MDLDLLSSPRSSCSFAVSLNDSFIHPISWARSFEVIFDSSLSLTSRAQPSRKGSRLCLQTPRSLTLPEHTPVLVTAISCLGSSKSLPQRDVRKT